MEFRANAPAPVLSSATKTLPLSSTNTDCGTSVLGKVSTIVDTPGEVIFFMEFRANAPAPVLSSATKTSPSEGIEEISGVKGMRINKMANNEKAVNFRFKAICEIITHPQIQKMSYQNELN